MGNEAVSTCNQTFHQAENMMNFPHKRPPTIFTISNSLLTFSEFSFHAEENGEKENDPWAHCRFTLWIYYPPLFAFVFLFESIPHSHGDKRMLMQLWNVKLSHKALWPHPTFWLLLLPPCGRSSVLFGGFLPWALSLSPVIPTILHWKLLHMTWLLESKVTSMLLFDNQFSLGGFNGFGK